MRPWTESKELRLQRRVTRGFCIMLRHLGAGMIGLGLTIITAFRGLAILQKISLFKDK